MFYIFLFVKNSLPLFWIHPMFRNQGPFHFFSTWQTWDLEVPEKCMVFHFKGSKLAIEISTTKHVFFLISFSKKRSENLTEISQCLWCLWVLDFFWPPFCFVPVLFIWSIFAKNSKITPSNLGFMTYSKNCWTLKKLSQPIYLITHKVDSYRHPA